MAYLRVALTNLGKYNEGELIFEWLDLPASDEQIEKAFKNIGVADGTMYEEHFISDYETDIEGLEVGEYESLSQLNETMEKLDALDDYEIEEVEAIMEAEGLGLAEAIGAQQEGDFIYYGGIKSYTELAEMFVDEGCFGEIPENLQYYIDYEKIGRDLEYDYTQTKNGFLSIA